MDRIRDLASRQRASLSSLVISRSYRKTVNDDVKSTTSLESTASKPIDTTTTVSFAFDPQPIQPAQSSQVTVQAEPTGLEDQAKSTTNTEVCKAKKKKNGGKTKKNKAHRRRASMERLEADQKLFHMAEAVVKQNEIIPGTGCGLSLRMNKLARYILEANKYIEQKEREIAEINNRLKVMEVNFNEAKKQLEMAQLLASQVIESGCWEQCKRKTKTQLHDSINSIVEDVKTSDVGTWSKEKIHACLKDLLVIYSANEDTVHSRYIGQSIVSLAHQFISHGKYDEEYEAILFHLANGHDYKKFLLRSLDEDHRAASRYPPNHVYRHLHGARKTQTGKEYAADIDKSVLSMVNTFEHSASHDKIMGGSLEGFFNPIPSTKLMMGFMNPPSAEVECVVPGCHCEELERGEFLKWAVKLRGTLSHKQYTASGVVRRSFTETIDDIATEAHGFGIEVTLACINGDSLPVIQFLYEKEDHPTKSPGIIKKLQASVERYGFRFGPCKSHGKVGYHIIPAEMVNGKISMSMQQKYMQKRMEIYKIIKEEVKTFMDEIWGPCANESDKQRKDQITDLMDWYSSDYYVTHGSQFLEDWGTNFETCAPEHINMLKRACVMCAKQSILNDYSKLELSIQDLVAHKLGGSKESKAK
ncbi:hypothetical protein VMCG_10623 [Cytospora schulzeri]|uniref:Uncharacterized protein n=1 Tax=Cytospora schulzeri TaxID=448051 RepID=A0A423V9W6_9PEZI|nr:hypothetical protein VMCG_10623 [Valsa malicola]